MPSYSDGMLIATVPIGANWSIRREEDALRSRSMARSENRSASSLQSQGLFLAFDAVAGVGLVFPANCEMFPSLSLRGALPPPLSMEQALFSSSPSRRRSRRWTPGRGSLWKMKNAKQNQ